jgi:aryl-alcohol dehydrogenase-like predicted oxidoreductase
MHNIIEQGKALYWGTSEWAAADIVSAIEVAERHHLHKPVVEQPVYNLLERHRFAPEYEKMYREYGYGATTWSPLASGLLSGKYQDGIPAGSRASLEAYDWLQPQLTDPAALARVAALKPLADDIGASLAQFSLAWCLQNPLVSSVITGASRLQQVEENMQAIAFKDRFTSELLASVDQAVGITPTHA